MPFWFIAAATASPLQVSVTGADDAKAVHVFFGDAGEVMASCHPGSKGWYCDSVDVARPSTVGVIVDTVLLPVGSIEENGSALTLIYDQGAFEPLWKQQVPPAKGVAPGLLVIRVKNANPNQAPMLRADLGGVKTQMGCADDGSFPDSVPNDGIFFCATTIPVSMVESDSWTATFTMRDAEGEDVDLGALNVAGGNGVRFASLTIGDASLASGDSFPLSIQPLVSDGNLTGGDGSLDNEGGKATALEGGSLSENGQPSPESPKSADPVSPEAVVPPSPIPDWLWLAIVFGLGVYAGRGFGPRKKVHRVDLDAAQPKPVLALPGEGPTPSGDPVHILSTNPDQTFRCIVEQMTVLRRAVVMGDAPTADIKSGHTIFEVTDNDKNAVLGLIKTLCSDGGVPPVLLILGSGVVGDTGGASPTPTEDLIAMVRSVCWVAWIEPEDANPSADIAVWGHDEQAGWSVR